MNIIDYGALNNKYTIWYNHICQHALMRSTTRKEAKIQLGYVEGHHIIPNCIFPNKNYCLSYYERAFFSALVTIKNVYRHSKT